MQSTTCPTPLKERPYVYVKKIQCRKGLILYFRKVEPPYGIENYLRRGNEVILLDLKRFAVMKVGDGDERVVCDRGGSQIFHLYRAILRSMKALGEHVEYLSH